VYDGLALLVGGVWRSSAKESFANVHYRRDRRAFLFAQAGIKPVLDKSEPQQDDHPWNGSRRELFE
jgi:hypothetical protein